MPYTIVSKSNRMSIRFASSYLINFRGFKLSYVVRPENYNSTQAVGEGLSAVCDHEPMEIPKPVGETRPSMPEDGLWSSSAVQKERGNSAQKIAATSEVTPHQYPFVVALLVDELYFCGGSIVDNQHVLTAAHCTDGYWIICGGTSNKLNAIVIHFFIVRQSGTSTSFHGLTRPDNGRIF